ncbi:MAG: recombinase family protein [Thermodesulfobacteriota bacterium]
MSRDSKSHVKFIHGIKVLMAKNYIDNLSEEVKKGMREKIEQGGFPGKAPVGYINNTKTHTVDVDEEKAGFIRKLFEWYTTGKYSLDDLRKKCKERSFVTRRSEKVISRSNVEKILKSIFYTGFFKWNGGFYKGSHTPIVSQEIFDRVQKVFKNHNKPKKRERDFAYKGLLTCGNCGCAITAEIKKSKYIYYHCTGFKGKCGEPYLREETLEEKFGDPLKYFRIDRERFQWIKEALKLSHEEESRRN